jgi:hypothetical protein
MIGLKRTSVLVAAVGLLLCPAALAQDCEIRLNRPMKVGQEYQVSATGREVQKATVTVNGQVVKNENQETAIEVKAAVRVLEIDKNGAPSKLSLKIGQCLEVKGETKTPLAPAGATVIASLDGKRNSVFEVDGQRVGPDAQRALAQVFSLGKGGPTDDQMLGTAQRKKPGDSWPINAELTAEDARQNGVVMNKEDLAGTVTLEKVVKVGGTECLQVAVAMDVARVRPPAPAGLLVDKGTARIGMSGLFPVNPALNVPEKSSDMLVTIVMKGKKTQPDAPDLVVETVAERQTTVRYTYAKK